MINPANISESLETNFLEIHKLFDADPGSGKFGSGMENIQIRDKHPGSATLINYSRPRQTCTV
jgi:hypothetical protein